MLLQKTTLAAQIFVQYSIRIAVPLPMTLWLDNGEKMLTDKTIGSIIREQVDEDRRGQNTSGV